MGRFFQENRFLVGVSLDGTIHTHDRWRKNIRGEGTFRRVMEGIDSLNRYRVPFNILTVVTGDVARTADKVYRFLRKQGFDHLQFIPCMDPLGGKEKSAYSLSGEEYGDFLCRIFDLWYDELCRGEQVWIRQFDNYVDMLSGYEPEACDMRGRCGKNYVIEADGSVYPCDFYALDQWKIGDIKREGWEEINRNREKKGFLEEISLPEECRKCPWAALCRGGCRRYREGEQGKHCFCAAYRKFFETCGERLAGLAQAVEEGAYDLTNCRKEKIKELLAENEIVSKKQLEEALGVSPSTVQRNMAAMEKEGILSRLWGGAQRIRDVSLYKRKVEEGNLTGR